MGNDTSSEPAGQGKRTDWEAIERDYRAGVLSIREVAKAHGVSDKAVRNRAKLHDWVRATIIRNTIELDQHIPDAFDTSGFVYVLMLDSGAERFFKIGLSKQFGTRLATHQCSSPFPILVACCYFVANMRAEERALHDKFDGQRVRGEWFRLSGADLKNIAARAILVSHD